MSMIKRGMRVPARFRLLACGLLLMASSARAAQFDAGYVDVHTLPMLQGAIEDNTRPDPYRVQYGVPTVVAVTTAAVKKMLVAEGWVPYVRPLDETNTNLAFKKGRQGLSVSFTQGLGRPDQSAVSYSPNRIYSNVPFPDGAIDLVFDETRPYLGCIAPSAFDTTMAFYAKEMTAIGWRKLTPETAASWPNADLSETVPNGVRAFFDHPDGNSTQFYKQKPVMLTLTRRDDGRTNVDIRIAPFALPTDLEAGDVSGLPEPKPYKSSSGRGNAQSAAREITVAALADLPAVLAFYHREFAARGWAEQGSAPLAPGDEVALKFSSPEENGVLHLGRKYDFTMVHLTAQVKESVLAARARAKKDADDQFMKDAEAMTKQVLADDAARRKTQAAALSDAPLQAQAGSTTPVPLPENAQEVDFDGASGRLEFNATSSVKALAAFYRASLKQAGWKEQPSVINQPNMAVMEFSKGGKSISLTVMQMGPKVNVSADGSGLKMAAANPASKAKGGPASNDPADTQAKASGPLEADPEFCAARAEAAQFDLTWHRKTARHRGAVPPRARSQRTRRAQRRAAFYRSELTKLGWQEKPDGAMICRRSRPARLRVPAGTGHVEARPCQWRDVGQSGAEEPGGRDQGGHHAQARTGKAAARQYGRPGRATHDQQADHQGCGRRRWPSVAEGPMLDLPPASTNIR